MDSSENCRNQKRRSDTVFTTNTSAEGAREARANPELSEMLENSGTKM